MKRGCWRDRLEQGSLNQDLSSHLRLYLKRTYATGETLMNRPASLAAVLLASTLSTFAQEKKIDPSTLPSAVQKTVQEQSKGATIKGYATEREHGKTVYEVEMMVDGHSKDIQIAEDGMLNEVEEEVAFASLPVNVQAALTAKAGGAKITKVESLTKHNKLVAYEAATLKGAKKGEIQVGPDGGKLSHEE
jgi:hypothetical protein